MGIGKVVPESTSPCLVALSTVPGILRGLVFILCLASPQTVGAYHHQQQQRHQKFDRGLSSRRAIPVLYESDRILIVNKPHGMAHHHQHTDHGNDEGNGESGVGRYGGILHWLRHERRQPLDQEMEEGREEQHHQRLWGVHRLDRVTSGILVLAKDVEMASTLSRHFARGEIQKVYFGLSRKKPLKKKQGWVQGGMERSRDKSWKLVQANHDRNSNAETSTNARTKRHPNFAKTRFFTARIAGGGKATTVAMFRPYTGKTHQLRVAAKAMGIPLIGDPIYKDGSNQEAKGTARAATLLDGTTDDDNSHDDGEAMPGRTMLHASGIHIPALTDKNGVEEEAISIWCPPPFFEERRDTADGDCLADEFDVAVKQLMVKNCDVPGILEAMMRSELEQLNLLL